VRLEAREELSTGFRGRIYLQLRPSEALGGRLMVYRAVMAGVVPISARTWRGVPIAEVEASAMLPYNDEVLRRPTDRPLALDEVLDRYFDETEPQFGPPTDFTPETTRLLPWDVPVIEGPVQAPKGRITEEFLAHVASAYAWAAAQGLAPAPAIAEQADVPVRTVHGWISQARKRGHLPPGRPGRAG
jgi:hypothetical protein